MTDIKPSSYIIGIIIFTLIIMCTTMIFNETFKDKPDVLESDRYVSFNRTFNKMEDISREADLIEQNMLSSKPDMGVFGVLNGLIQSAWYSLRLITKSMGFMKDVYMGVFTELGVPKFVPTLIILLIGVGIVFAIYSAIFQGKV